MNRKVIGSVVAVALAALGTFLLLAYVRSADDRAIAGERVVPVYVVRDVVAEGTLASDLGDRVELERVPVKVQATGAVSDLKAIEGQVAAVDLVPGEQLLATRFLSQEDAAQVSGVKVPEGLQEVTLPLSTDRAAGGRISAGDTVGVVASFNPFDLEGSTPDGEGGAEDEKTPNTTRMIMHKVLVTDVRGGTTPPPAEEGAEGPSGAPGDTLLVTLAVDTNAVEKLVFTAEFGMLWLSAEPDNAAEEPTQIETRGTIYE